MRVVVWLAAVAVVVVAACGRSTRTVEVPAGAGSPPELGSSLNVRVSGDTVHFELHITNTTSGPVTITFPSSQRYDFAVTRPNGESLWHWSAARSFAQVTGSEQLGAGETRRYSETWVWRGQAGEYVATAWLTSSNYPVELRTVFRLPAE